MTIEEKKTAERNKGGRPKKAVKRNYVVKIKCAILERKVIERSAKEVDMKLSEYLREKGLAGNIVRQQKVLPKEFLGTKPCFTTLLPTWIKSPEKAMQQAK